MAFLGGLGNLLGDLDFWGGVAEGASIDIARQEDRREKDHRELRKWGMERGLQISEDNREALDLAESQVKELASLISGGRSVSDPVVMEAALYLVDQHGGIQGAARVAKDLNAEYSTFGVDPITRMGLTPRVEGVAPTAKDVARTFTKLKPLPRVDESSIMSRKTALDVILGRDTVEDSVASEMKSMFGADEQTAAMLSPVKAEGFDQELILGTNYSNELKRMHILLNKHNKVPENQKNEEWKQTETLIKSNIEMLNNAIDLSKPMSDSEREKFERSFLQSIVITNNLKGDFDLNGSWKAQDVKGSVYSAATEAVASMSQLLQVARNNGYIGKVDGDEREYDALEFIKIFGASKGNKIILVTPEIGSPYLTVGGKIFDDEMRKSDAWKQSITLDGTQTPPPPDVGSGATTNPPVTGGASNTNQTAEIDALVSKITNAGLNSSVRKSNATALMSRLKVNNRTMSQTELEQEFKRITGLDYNSF